MTSLERKGSSLRQIVRERRESAADAVTRLNLQSSRLTLLAVGCGVVAGILSALAGAGVQERLLAGIAAGFTAVSVGAAQMHRNRIEGRLKGLEVFAARMDELGMMMDEGRIPSDEAIEHFGAALQVCPAIPCRALPAEAARGTIDSPCQGDHLPEHFVASGTVEDVGDEVYLWLTVRIGDYIWPKNGRIHPHGGRWDQRVHHTNPGEFGLTLWAVTPAADQELRGWLEEGTRRRNYSGTPPLVGMYEIAHVPGLRGGVRDASRGKRVRRRLAVLISGDERFAHHP